MRWRLLAGAMLIVACEYDPVAPPFDGVGITMVSTRAGYLAGQPATVLIRNDSRHEVMAWTCSILSLVHQETNRMMTEPVCSLGGEPDWNVVLRPGSSMEYTFPTRDSFPRGRYRAVAAFWARGFGRTSPPVESNDFNLQ